jgi:ATP-dependent helicase IRC3
MNLRPYQVDTLNAVAVGLERGSNRLLIKSPTGTGKTVTFAQLRTHLRDWLAQFPERSRSMLVIAHREELLDQAADKIQRANPGLTVMVEQGDRRASPYADVIVASIQTLAAMKFRRLKRLLQYTTFRIVVVDECHHAAATTYRTALAHLGFLPASVERDDASDDIEVAKYEDVELMAQSLAAWDAVAPKDRLLVGVTATPNRSDAVGLGCVFQTIAYSYDLKHAIGDGWLVPITPWAIETKTSLDDVHLQRGDFNQRELASTVNTPERNLLAVTAWREHAEHRSTIAFTVDVQHAYDLAETFKSAGYGALAISGETPKDVRREGLALFQAGEIEVLTNCMVLTEGTDLPRASCILHAKPTKSATLYEQMTGRGLRLFPDKTECVVIDLVDVARKHSLQSAPVLYGLPPGLIVKGKKLEEVADGLDAFLQQHPGFDLDAALKAGHLTLDQLNALARKVNIWDIPTLGDFGEGRIVQWLKLAEDRYRVTYPWNDGTEILEVTRDLIGHWDVVITLRPSDRAQPKRQRTLATQMPSALSAADAAEAFISRERRSVLRLKGVDAPWMTRPATNKQLGFLKTLGVTQLPKGITMGMASQLIELAKARKSRA